MVYVAREIAKAIMFTVIWAFPTVLALWEKNNWLLWFYALSVIMSVGIFSHYEDLNQPKDDKGNRFFGIDCKDDE